ncbi:putative high mobility group protein B4 [Plasmodium gaboni]|uniref:High mobility group protein B4, putative n=1 Tax=Plasmodium gaboni TaxID=647221 RepID=A0A151LER0_9APIC|nr:putative high mobility group protein B4 [Plasmodium gaboni]KYN97356.1 putative high mobility group protein B4 [Plasmodium gaboni]SOV18155.1 high mobility group protein B4, putative [Plasmodium gaboni]
MDRKKPKAPPSSYLIFCNYERENAKNTLLQKCDKETIRITDIQKELSNKWKNLPEDERKKYEEQAQILKLKYNEELLEWKNHSNENISGDLVINHTAKFPVMKIQKIMQLNRNVKKVNNEAINIFQKAVMMFLIELVNKTIEFKDEKNTARNITSFDILSCIQREGIKYKFLEDCIYLLKEERGQTFFDEEDIQEETLFDLCEEDKKEYNYDVEEKKISKLKKKVQGSNKIKDKAGINKNIYADITTFFKKI